ncbi:TonB family protein [Pseudomonas putida]|uniref:cell envelope integrity protein TolA n=1 Tax=Pseudomonas putida TaxID=303 RepID=UPI002363968F|nr:cell envelope integrity protein TolA [Pseudomonas putida]MDD2139516.1 TonB family protein [Pseudomonas putida]HDS1721844.1 TonB family protein [Pseudomonas putida]
MKESKLSYIALAISVGAAALCGVSAMLSVFPNSSRIDKLSSQVATLSEQNAQLRAVAPYVGDNRSRINELDVGVTALANVLKVDRGELANAIAAVKAAQMAEDRASKPTSKPHEGDGNTTSNQSMQPTLAVSASQTKAGSQAPVPVGRNTNKPELGQPIDSSAKPPTEAVRHAEAQDKTPPLMGADNPFAAGLENTNAGGEVAPAISVSSANTGSMTIEQVDAVLGKRLSSNWYKPAGVIDGLSTIIQLKMSREGKVATVRIGKSSGNQAFDSSALSAVQSIGSIDEIRKLSDADFKKAYASRSIQFTPQMGQ